MRVYEINPQVIDLALKEFSYLGDTKAQLDVVLGDARLSLEREPPQAFDVLAVDAFSSDSIPVHLLTAEAFESVLPPPQARAASWRCTSRTATSI